jgi:hypothetical protein
MESRDALGTVRALGRAAGPVAAAVITLGAMVAPAVAQHGHHASRARHASSTETHTRHIRGVVTAVASDGSSITIARSRHEHNNCLAPRTITLMLDGSTTFSTPSNPTAALTDVQVGDAVTVAIAVPPGTDPTTVPATSVADRGAAAPMTCVVRGVASGPSTAAGVTITVQTGRGRHGRHRHGHHDSGRRNSGLHRRFAAAPGAPVSLNVQFDSNTTFVDIPTPAATIGQIAPGDRLTVIWSVVPGTALDGAPAAKVIDWGPPPPIRYVARGVAASVPGGTSFGLTVSRIHPNVSPAFADGSVLPVSYDSHTVFVDVANPGATIDQIAAGDRLIVVWSAPRGTQAVNLPAAVRIVDLGPNGTPV